MSSRQMRRLQQLVETATGLDDEMDEPMVNTMKPTKKGRKNKVSKDDAHEDGAPAKGADAHPRSSTPPNHAEHKGREEQHVHADPSNLPAQSAKPARQGKAKKSSKAQRQRQEEEEDALLDAAIERAHNEAPAPDCSDCVPTCASVGQRLLRHLLCCTTTSLNTRQERIRVFGVNSVEDVGDGMTPKCRPDGSRFDNGSNSLFAEHHQHLIFRNSALATPNRYRWPAFDGLGLEMRRLNRSDANRARDTEEALRELVDLARAGPATSTHLQGCHDWAATASNATEYYELCSNSSAFELAEMAREECAARAASVGEFAGCLRFGPYHIPTLIQLSTAFQMVDDAPHATEMVEMALYHTGLLLSAPGMLSSTWRERVVPHCLPGNGIVFGALLSGLFSALKRGCLQTAFEQSRLLLSLDPADPCGSLLFMDYFALRARRWMWLVEMHAMVGELLELSQAWEPSCRTPVSAEDQTSTSVEEGSCVAREDGGWALALVERLLLMPNLAMSVALAKIFIEREQHDALAKSANMEAPRANQRAREPKASPWSSSKVLRELSEEQTRILNASPSAESLLMLALLRFPYAAYKLGESMDLLSLIGPIPRSSLLKQDPSALLVGHVAVAVGLRMDDEVEGEAASLTGERHLAKLFLTRHGELWKAGEANVLLRKVWAKPLCQLDESVGFPWRDYVNGLQNAMLQDQHQGNAAAPWWSSLAPRVDGPVPKTYFYLSTTEAQVMGERQVIIPRELLAQEQEVEDSLDDGADWEDDDEDASVDWAETLDVD